MRTNIISLEETVDDALRSASRVLMLISLPALMAAAYRNLFIDFLPLYQLTLTLIWLGFFIASLNFSNLIKIRLNLVVLLFLILFILTAFRNESIIFVDLWLIIAGGLMAFRQSLVVVLGTLMVFPVALLFIMTEKYTFPGVSYELHLIIHGTAFLLSLVLFYTIRNVVENYKTLYESQVDVNANLVEENKKSFLQIAEGRETAEEERQRLKLSAFSLSSQMSILEKLVDLAKKNDDPNLLGFASSRIEDLHKDLLEYAENGRYISSETRLLTVSELAFLIEQYLKPFKDILSNSTLIDVNNSTILEAKFRFPINFLKIICHHLIEHCLDEFDPKKILFKFKNNGNEVRSRQQVLMICEVYCEKDFKQYDFAKVNKRFQANNILSKNQNHLGVINVISKRLFGSFQAFAVSGAIRYEFLFWVESESDASLITEPPKIRDIFGFN